MTSHPPQTAPLPEKWPLTKLTLQAAPDGGGLLLTHPGQTWHVSPDLRLKSGPDAEKAMRAVPGTDQHFLSFDSLNLYLGDARTADALIWLHRWKRQQNASGVPDDAELQALHARLNESAFGQGLHFLHPTLNAALTAYLAPMQDDQDTETHVGWMLDGLSDRPQLNEENLPWAVVCARLTFLHPDLTDDQCLQRLAALKTQTPWQAMALLGSPSRSSVLA